MSLEALWSIVGAIGSIIIGLGSGIAMTEATPNEFKFARCCFWASALMLGLTTIYWSMKTDASLPIRIFFACIVGCSIFVLFPEAIRWVKAKEAKVRSSKDATGQVSEKRLEGMPGTPSIGTLKQAGGGTNIGINNGTVIIVAKDDPKNPSSSAPTPSAQHPPELGMQGILFPYDYFPGEKIAGILWKKGYSKVSVIVSNPTGDTYSDLDLTLNTDLGIIGTGIRSDLNIVKIVPIKILDAPTILEKGVDGATVAIDSDDEGSPDDILIVSQYRMRCEKFAQHSAIEIILAVVRPTNDETAPEVFSSIRVDPKMVHIVATFSLNNKQWKAEKTLPLGK
jgi:hypothetical protein